MTLYDSPFRTTSGEFHNNNNDSVRYGKKAWEETGEKEKWWFAEIPMTSAEVLIKIQCDCRIKVDVIILQTTQFNWHEK